MLDADVTAKLKEQVAELVEPVYFAGRPGLADATADLEHFFKQADDLRATVIGSNAGAGTIER